MTKQDKRVLQTSNETDVAVLVKKMQQQLVYLEKKIDLLIDQSSFKGQGRGNYPKSSTRSRGPYERGNKSTFGTKSRIGGGRFEKRHKENDWQGGYKPKTFGESQKNSAGGGRYENQRNFGKNKRT